MNNGLLVVISGPSGVGKGTVLKEVFEKDDRLAYSVSLTTRAPREGEHNGVEYNFVTKDEFLKNVENGRMLEYTEYCGNYYGTSAEYVERQRADGKDVILEIETEGGGNVKRLFPDSVLIFIAPPSVEELERRLTERGTENPEAVARRIKRAKEELASSGIYDYIVTNDTVERAAEEIAAILRAERIKNNILRGE